MRSFQGEALCWEQVDAGLEVELKREPCNEIGTTTLRELEQLASYIRDGAGGAQSVLFYSSRDKGFCAGADLRELYSGIIVRQAEGATSDAIGDEARDFIERIHRVFDTFDTAPVTTIAAVHGFCFGGGFELALTCDIVVADKSARFCFPELRLGLVPGFGGIPRLNRDLGNAVVRDLLLTGRSINATRAHAVGLIAQVVRRGEALNVARMVAQQSARFDARTTRIAKQFLKPLPSGELAREREIFLSQLTSPVVQQALKKFVESTDVRPYLP